MALHCQLEQDGANEVQVREVRGQKSEFYENNFFQL